jgi:hypothetical protein
MEFWIVLAGLALGLGGALVVALADAWLSQSLLVYLDAVEANWERWSNPSGRAVGGLT